MRSGSVPRVSGGREGAASYSPLNHPGNVSKSWMHRIFRELVGE